jgi:2-amino-4-hydroxy-6-hydroxymethyldihydropteridine diphosphokinase|tara:strand:+ start:1599 stop:2126 length:528 start_codon:yes stop_codon:yes gene_type:complete
MELVAVSSKVFVGFGSNLGDKSENIRLAINEIKKNSLLLKASGIYESFPLGFSTQPNFLNSVCELTTDLDPWGFLRRLMFIEESFGRTRTFVNAPREIDLDILLWGSMRINQPGLVIPHPRMESRGFVLGPLLELDPAIIHPHSCRPLIEVYNSLGKFDKPVRINVKTSCLGEED